jgi:DNA polymerase III alpha subunit (gram-positive type)
MLFCVHDTETTGLPLHRDVEASRQPKIIEFAGILTDGNSIIEEVEFMCDPGEPLESIITKITGLTDEVLKGKPTFQQSLPRLSAYFAKGDAAISHNLSFDKGMVKFSMDRIGKTLADCNYPLIEICSVEQTFHHYGRRMKLTELYEILVGPYVQKHRAMDDVMMLHEVCKRSGIYAAYAQQAAA